MAINTGIYITGLGQSFHQESVEKYAERIKNELSFTTTGTKYDLKAEKVYYSSDKQSTCVSIIKSDGGSESVVYKLYEFQYHEILTEKFQHRNILSKSLILLMLVIKKFPQILLRIFSSDNFNRPYQTFYAFLILLIISFAIIFLIPATIDMIPGISITHTINEIFGYFGAEIDKDGWFWTKIAKLKEIAKVCVPITTLTLLLVPQSKTIVTTMATEFACVDRYMRNGEQSQIVLGNLDKLVEYIAETEINSKIHFHCYSFGSVIATDILFPIGTIPSQNIQSLATSLITIGNPYEFIKAYYPDFYKKRCTLMDSKLEWINIYSIADALATNFKKDAKIGDAEFGIIDNKLIPQNLNFEVTSERKIGFLNFISLYSISVHKCYWDSSPTGLSCVRTLLPEMLKKSYIEA